MNCAVKHSGSPTLKKWKDFPDYFAGRTGADHFNCRPYTREVEAREISNLSDCHKQISVHIFLFTAI